MTQSTKTYIFALTVVFAVWRYHTPVRLPLPTMQGEMETWGHIFEGFLFGVWACDIKKNKFALIVCLTLGVFELILFLLQAGKL